MRIKVLVAPILVGLVSIAHAQVAPSDNEPGATAALHDVSGTYASTWGVMTLHQNGNHVIGSYTFNDGQIDGTFDGTRLRFSWREEGGGAGFGVFVVRSDGQLDGSWGVNDDHSSGAWTATLGSATDLSNNLPRRRSAIPSSTPVRGRIAHICVGGSETIRLTRPTVQRARPAASSRRPR